MDKKRLYAVLWIDDYGSMRLRNKDVEWYHKNAGPISYAFEWDDQYPWAIEILASDKNEFSRDYLAYHFHPIRWIGAATPKKIYDFLRLHYWVYGVLRIYRQVPFSQTFLRLKNILIFLVLAVVAQMAMIDNRLLNILSLVILFVISILGGTWYYVKNPKNWEYMISNHEWNKKFILKSKKKIEELGIRFPRIVRHGWNLPWKDSMNFYKELGIIADASAVFLGPDNHPKIANREIMWKICQPYFMNIEEDFDVKWDRRNRNKKGLLELPVVLGNISFYGFGDREKEVIRQIPEGGLVSAYIHPEDKFEPIKEWVKHLKQNYDVQFVSAEYAAKEIFYNL